MSWFTDKTLFERACAPSESAGPTASTTRSGGAVLDTFSLRGLADCGSSSIFAGLRSRAAAPSHALVSRRGLKDFYDPRRAVPVMHSSSCVGASEGFYPWAASCALGMKTATAEQYVMTALEFRDIMTREGENPATLTVAKFFLYAYVLLTVKSPRIAGKTMRQKLSHLRGAERLMPPGVQLINLIDTVEEPHAKELAGFLAQIEKHYPSGREPRKPFGLREFKLIRPVQEAVRAAAEETIATYSADASADARFATAQALSRIAHLTYESGMLKLYHQAMLRNEEGRKLQRKHAVKCAGTNSAGVTFRSIKLTLYDTKTGPGPYVVFVAERNDELDVYAWLSAIIDENDDPEGFLLDITRVGATAAGASEAVTALMRRWLRSAGVLENALSSYSCHSLRHGGASDLLDSGVASDIVAKQGRWASLVWLTVYRHLTDRSAHQLTRLGTDPVDGLSYV